VLNDIADAIAAGVFVRWGEGGDCARCDYKRACSELEIQLAAAKREALIPIERLASHE
jgi:hypothetical protein